MWVFLIHSARSNEISLVTAAHMHGIVWHRQIWQTLKQNALDVCIRVGVEAAPHLHCDQLLNFFARKADARVWLESSFLPFLLRWRLLVLTALL